MLCHAEDTHSLFKSACSHGTKCPICKKVSITEKEAVIHINKRHPKFNEVKDFLCSKCDIPFFNIPSLTSLVSVDHYNHQPFQCSHCKGKKMTELQNWMDTSKGYIQKRGLVVKTIPLWQMRSKTQPKEHKESIHSGVLYPWDYPGCSKSYSLKGNLYAHRFRVHRISRPMARKKDLFLWVLKILWVHNWGCIFVSKYIIKFSFEKSTQRLEYHLFLGPFNIQFSTRICSSC